MAEEMENNDIPLAVEVSGDDGSQDETFDIPVIAVTKISDPEDIIEESIDIPLAVEVSGDEGSQEESFGIPSTTEINEAESCNVEVIVDINTPKIKPKILSRYRLPYTGSCHDFCKYGLEQSLEGKPASRVSRKAKLVGGDGRDLRRIMISLAKQNKDAISPNSSPDYNAINITELKEDVQSSPEIVTPSPKRILPSIKEVHAAAVHYSRTKINLSLSKTSSFPGQGSSRIKRNKEVRKGKKKDGDGSPRSCTNSTSRRQKINISAEENVKALVPRVVSWSSRTRVKRVAIADKKIIGRRVLKNQGHPIKCKRVPCNNEDVEEKTIYMIEPSTKNETEESTQRSVHTTELSQPQSFSATDNSVKHEQKANGTPILPPLSVKKNVRRAKNGTSSKILSTSPSASRVYKGMRPKTRSAPSSPLSSRCPSEPVHGEHGGPTSRNDVKKSEKSRVEHKTRRMTLTDTENEDRQSRILKFRKGRMVELQTETNVPRRLKFRTQSPKSDSRRMTLTDSENEDYQSRILKFRNRRMVELQTETNSPRRLKFRSAQLRGETQSPKSDSRRMTLTDPENEDCQSRILKFRNRRMVELQAETNSPRRLKFRRARLLGETQSPKSDSRRMTLTDSENEDCQSRILKFRNRRMVELQTETNSPRRLKFPCARLLGEIQSPKSDSRKRDTQGKEANQNGNEVKEAENSSLRQQDQEIKKKRSFRRKVEPIDGKLISSRSKSERVVLRHQDSKGKKEIQNLFNNVIEETASKLAQTRKSKVKALVGAFETVISLQDTRPAAIIAA